MWNSIDGWRLSTVDTFCFKRRTDSSSNDWLWFEKIFWRRNFLSFILGPVGLDSENKMATWRNFSLAKKYPYRLYLTPACQSKSKSCSCQSYPESRPPGGLIWKNWWTAIIKHLRVWNSSHITALQVARQAGWLAGWQSGVEVGHISSRWLAWLHVLARLFFAKQTCNCNKKEKMIYHLQTKNETLIANQIYLIPPPPPHESVQSRLDSTRLPKFKCAIWVKRVVVACPHSIGWFDSFRLFSLEIKRKDY